MLDKKLKIIIVALFFIMVSILGLGLLEIISIYLDVLFGKGSVYAETYMNIENIYSKYKLNFNLYYPKYDFMGFIFSVLGYIMGTKMFKNVIFIVGLLISVMVVCWKYNILFMNIMREYLVYIFILFVVLVSFSSYMVYLCKTEINLVDVSEVIERTRPLLKSTDFREFDDSFISVWGFIIHPVNTSYTIIQSIPDFGVSVTKSVYNGGVSVTIKIFQNSVNYISSFSSSDITFKNFLKAFFLIFFFDEFLYHTALKLPIISDILGYGFFHQEFSYWKTIFYAYLDYGKGSDVFLGNISKNIHADVGSFGPIKEHLILVQKTFHPFHVFFKNFQGDTYLNTDILVNYMLSEPRLVENVVYSLPWYERIFCYVVPCYQSITVDSICREHAAGLIRWLDSVRLAHPRLTFIGIFHYVGNISQSFSPPIDDGLPGTSAGAAQALADRAYLTNAGSFSKSTGFISALVVLTPFILSLIFK